MKQQVIQYQKKVIQGREREGADQIKGLREEDGGLGAVDKLKYFITTKKSANLADFF